MSRYNDTMETVSECPGCHSTHIISDPTGEMVCAKCGDVIESNYIVKIGTGCNTFSEGTEDNSPGPATNIMRPNRGLGSFVGGKGDHIDPKYRSTAYRLKRTERRNRFIKGIERSMNSAIPVIRSYSADLGLPEDVQNQCAFIYKQALNAKLIRGRSTKIVAAASIYAACRMIGLPRTLDECANASCQNRREVGRTYRFMTKALKLKMKLTSPSDYIRRFCSELHVSNAVVQRTLNILEQAESKNLTMGKGPTGVAAAAIYMACINCNERRTQFEVAKVAFVTEVTIRHRYKEMIDELGLIVNI